MNSLGSDHEICEATGISGSFRTIQIHPTLRCNLLCKHCYSSSSPVFKTGLESERLLRFIQYAERKGFNAISLSGGEPLMYRELDKVVQFAKSLGMRTGMVSNGMLLGSEFAGKVLESVDIVAISIDGEPEWHDYMRGQKGAFQHTLRGIEILRNLHKPFGFIHTITSKSWESLIWLADFAVSQGARLLHLHPVENSGRASTEMSDYMLNDTIRYKIFILTEYLRNKYSCRLEIQLDLSHRDYIKENPEVVRFYNPDNSSLADRLEKSMNNIVVDEKGDIYPISYGISSKFRIGSIYQRSFEGMFERFLEEKGRYLDTLLSRTYDMIVHDESVDMVSWGEMIVEQSLQSSDLMTV
ncbi:Radical SAM superfamily enzyme, MoaA/NifB/PqqE/SkfB family [Pseudarcicella hirudinis]|uniref:Radical SAM superfamily enzyme, MoaA/NifB/PqqE/SkfB family n=1 Tax=Pseudarcicella hirudinis TaxID=1079859 RepID=A0A1I5UGG2_9BACT|nr:radical SAM protein [Pseudarcicella hirudinis]SFP94320.1 Radical SAM superfamily enzyme, MoaA/NifB/PqqE/SkfB family [Pseudarcicella hirudinis]